MQAVGDLDRLATLDDYDILDTPPEAEFDDIVELATYVCETPIALISFVASDRQWFKARIGFPHCQTDLNRSVCAHVLTEPDLLVIPDLAADPRTRDNPLVTGGPQIRFYAGAPLRDPRGRTLGSLCVIDKTPRPDGLTERQAGVLRNLGRQVMTLLELRRCLAGRDTHIARRRRAEERQGVAYSRLQISEAHWRGLFERLSEGMIIGEVVRDAAGHATDWRYLDVNPAWGELVGADVESTVGRTIREVFPGIEDEWVLEFIRVAETKTSVSFTRQVGSLQRWYEGRAFALDGDRFAVLFLEVTARIKAEADQQLLNEELSHRVKNMLAMVQAVAWQTLRGITEQAAVVAFRDRIQALSRAHDVLLQTSWAAAPLREVVNAVLGQISQIERLTIDGPEIMLGPRATLSISLLLHELATNAAKYGALACDTGRVAIVWFVDEAMQDLVFTWREVGGPPAAEPSREGFGSRLIKAGLMGTGGVSLRFETVGFSAEMRAGLAQVQAT